MEHPFWLISNSKGIFETRFSKEVYHNEAIKNAALKYKEVFFIKIDYREDGYFYVTFMTKDSSGKEDLLSRINDFHNDLLNEQIIIDLSNRYGKLREIIYEHAFRPIERNKEK